MRFPRMAIGLTALFSLAILGNSTPADARQLQIFGPTRLREMVPNGQYDPGEAVMASYCVFNGSSQPWSGVGTLVDEGGVTLSSGSQSYGPIGAGQVDCRFFVFKVNGTCGGAVRTHFRLDPGSDARQILLPLGAAGLAESFDTTPVGQLPPTISVVFATSAASHFAVSGAAADSPPHSLFAASPSAASETIAETRSVRLPSGNSTLTFRHSFSTETGFDGGVLEMSIGGAPFQDIIAAGGSFVAGPYNGAISNVATSPLAGRSAWTGNSNGFITTTVQMPAAAAGRDVTLRWRFDTDASVGGVGWYIDSIATSGVSCAPVSPDVPWGLIGGLQQDNLVKFEWFAPLSVTPAGYLLEASLDGGLTYPYRVPLGPIPSFTAVGPDAVVSVRVRTRHANGILSGPSNVRTSAIGAAAPPADLYNLQTMVNGSMVALAWSVGLGGTATRTVLSVGTTPGGADLGALALPPGATTFRVAGVPTGTYHVSVRQAGPLLLGAASNNAVVTVPGSCQPPQMPTSFNAFVENRVLKILWELGPPGSPAPTGWTLEAGSASQLSDLGVLTLANRTFTVSVPPGTYFLRVSAANPCGASAKTPTISVTVQ